MIRLVEVYVVEAVLSLVVVGWWSHIVAIHVAEVFVRMFHTHHLDTFKLYGSRLSDYPFVDDSMKAVVKHTHLVALGKGIFAQQASCHLLQPLLTDKFPA